MESLLFALWYLLPAGVSNMSPIFAARAPLIRDWNTPIDIGKTWRGKRIFGPHKTIRGLLAGTIAGVFIGLLQMLFVDDVGTIISLPAGLYDGMNPLYLGGLLGAGALVGDALESFFKRQIGVEPGKSWFPFDQIDYIVGACLFGMILQVLALSQYALILIVWFGLHLISSYIGFLLRLKKQPI